MPERLFQLLKKDHQEVKGIFKQLTEDGGNREELFATLKQELMPHMKSEEKVFYSALMDKEEVREETLESFEEHHVAELVFRELEKLPQSDERWAAKLSVLKELVEHHVKEEERKIFKSAQQNLDSSEIQEIMEKFEKEKEKLKQRMK
ncbi:MAG: hemerythrin domain-containing protein [Syntrophobacteraceae bacterium]